MRFAFALNPEGSFFLPNSNYFNINPICPEPENIPLKGCRKKIPGHPWHRREGWTPLFLEWVPAFVGATSCGDFSTIFQFIKRMKKAGQSKECALFCLFDLL
jgi:hypothetical protein